MPPNHRFIIVRERGPSPHHVDQKAQPLQLSCPCFWRFSIHVPRPRFFQGLAHNDQLIRTKAQNETAHSFPHGERIWPTAARE
jgi:hypothetical protein